jgi:hypothetical protein
MEDEEPHQFIDGQGSISKVNTSRRQIIESIIGAMILPILCNADEPSNVQIKSQADDEDPIAVFGQSLQDMNFDNSPSGFMSTHDSPSFSDILLPSSSPEVIGKGDLGEALEQKKREQKRRIDPMTHG